MGDDFIKDEEETGKTLDIDGDDDDDGLVKDDDEDDEDDADDDEDTDGFGDELRAQFEE